MRNILIHPLKQSCTTWFLAREIEPRTSRWTWGNQCQLLKTNKHINQKAHLWIKGIISTWSLRQLCSQDLLIIPISSVVAFSAMQVIQHLPPVGTVPGTEHDRDELDKSLSSKSRGHGGMRCLARLLVRLCWGCTVQRQKQPLWEHVRTGMITPPEESG